MNYSDKKFYNIYRLYLKFMDCTSVDFHVPLKIKI